jgi:hypothetical protein
MNDCRGGVLFQGLQKGEREKEISDLIEMDDAYFFKFHDSTA